MRLIKRVCLWSAFKIGTDVTASVLWFTFRQSPIVSVAHLPVLAHLSKQAAATWPWKPWVGPRAPPAALPILLYCSPNPPQKKHLHLTTAATHSPPNCLYFAISDVTSSPRLLSLRLRHQTADSEKKSQSVLETWPSPPRQNTHTYRGVLAPQDGDVSAATITHFLRMWISETALKMRPRISGTEGQVPADGWKLSSLIPWYFTQT